MYLNISNLPPLPITALVIAIILDFVSNKLNPF